MPNPLLVVIPNPPTPPECKVKVGDLLIRRRGDAKSVKARVVKVLAVHAERRSAGWTVYRYDVQKADGSKEYGISPYVYIPFSEQKAIITSNIQGTNKILTNQYRDLELTERLEREGKKAFE